MIKRFYYMFIRRLINRLKPLLRFREIWSWDYESCERCGSCFRLAYTVTNEKWQEVYGSERGCLCLSCFLELASLKDITVRPEDFMWLCIFNGDKVSHDIIKDPRDMRLRR